MEFVTACRLGIVQRTVLLGCNKLYDFTLAAQQTDLDCKVNIFLIGEHN